MEKAQAREHIKRAVSALSPCERARKSEHIKDALLQLPEFAGAKVVMLFASMPDEVDTLPIISAALEAGKTVVLPKVLSRAKEMITCPIADLDKDTCAGVYGILEPTGDTAADIITIDFCLVPARAFDRLGGRLGRGAGYYDRFMADPAFRAARCGIAFSVQILDTVPSQPHDLPVHIIVTDDGVIRPDVQG